MSLVEAAVRAHFQRHQAELTEPRTLDLAETGECPRKRVLRALGATVTRLMPEEAQRAAEAGRMWEQWLIVRMQETGKVYDFYRPIEGLDGVVGWVGLVMEEAGVRIPVHVKAVSQWAKNLPDPRHVDPVMAILHFYGRPRGITRAELAYIQRETGAVTLVVPIDYDPARGEAIQAELQGLRQAVDAGEAPPVGGDKAPNAFPCWYKAKAYEVHCPYWGHCWGGKVEPAGDGVPAG